MTVENQENQTNDSPENVVPDVSPAESQAREAGWVPKDDFQGDEHKWVDAGEFLRRGELFAKIEKQNKELKDVKKALQQLAEHNTKIKEVAFKEALESLKAQKKAAFEEGDADAIIEIDEKILDTKEAQRQAVASIRENVKREVEELHPEFQAWTQRNQWYVDHAPMKAFADALGADLSSKGMSPSEVLKAVEKQVKEEFPQRFRNANKDKPGAVESGSRKGASSTSGFQPSDMEKQIAKRFVRQGLFKTESDYYKQLEESK